MRAQSSKLGPDPGTLLAEIRRASQLLARGQRSEALLIYQAVSGEAGAHAPVQYELGNLCQEIGDSYKAVEHYRIAVAQTPDNAKYLAMLGIACLNHGDAVQARASLEAALAIDAEIVEAQHGLGIYYKDRSDFERAVVFLERACELKPSDIGVRKNLATVLAGLNRYPEALEHARKAARQQSSDPGAPYVLCEILAQTGEIDEAVQSLQQLVRRHKTFGIAYDLLARIRRFSGDDEPLIRQAEQALEKGMSPNDRVSLHFALGKMYDDCGRYEQAFAHFERANTQRKKPYDFRENEKLFKALTKLFSQETLDALAPLGDPSVQPVFIVGMPRSGTTLMERIIASHPRAAGAGELGEIWRITRLLFPESDGRTDYSHAKSELAAEKIAEHAASYLKVLRQGRPDAERIVDKMPTNSFLIGVIRVLFPRATIIHAVRNPLDTCLSCFFQNFTSVRWSSDLALIAKIYSLYRRSMDYWSSVLPPDAIVDMGYEDLIREPETAARCMLDACGLEWDPAVLAFAETKAVVKTASIAQARQPIYTTSRMRWMNYAGHLDELARGLAPFLEQDRELLKTHGIELPKRSGWLGRLLP